MGEQDRPGSGTALAIAEGLSPRITAAADEIDAALQIPPALAASMADAGLFRLLVPKVYGGLEVELPDYVDAVQHLGQADASTAWCVNQGCVWAALAAVLPEATSREIWADPRAAVANGTPVKAGAVEVEGGHELSGHWVFSSGCRHATWMAGMARVDGGDSSGSLQGLWVFLFPKEQAEIIDGWEVAGMRGTGSHEFRVERLFIPAERSVSMALGPHEPGPIYRIPRNLKFAVGFASVALGVARAALDFAEELASGKAPRFSTRLLRDDPGVQDRIGRAEAQWRAADLLLHTTVAEAWDSVVARGAMSVEQRMRMRMAGTHTIREADRVMELAYIVVGTTGIFQDQGFQRRYQDMKVITQHMQGRVSHYPRLGQYFLGMLDQTAFE